MDVNLSMVTFPVKKFYCLMFLWVLSFSALADSYEEGLIAYTEGDYQAAEQHFKSAARNGDAGAKYMLMRIYQEQKIGADAQKNNTKIKYWTKKAAESGIVQAQYALAEQYNHSAASQQDLKQAFYWYQKAVAQGHHGAMEKLGDLYQQGEIVDRDSKRAHRLYVVAASEYDVFAQKGDPAAQNALANMYENAKGVGRNIDMAINWYKKAALQDYAMAQYNLGRLFAQGEHVNKNTEEAVYWLRKAAGQGLAQARALLVKLGQDEETNVAMQ